jgi:hypothetical protein
MKGEEGWEKCRKSKKKEDEGFFRMGDKERKIHRRSKET